MHNGPEKNQLTKKSSLDFQFFNKIINKGKTKKAPNMTFIPLSRAQFSALYYVKNLKI